MIADIVKRKTVQSPSEKDAKQCTLIAAVFSRRAVAHSPIAVHPDSCFWSLAFFLFSIYRWWTSIIFIIRPTNCSVRRANSSWANRSRRSSRRFCRRWRDICVQFLVSCWANLFWARRGNWWGEITHNDVIKIDIIQKSLSHPIYCMHVHDSLEMWEISLEKDTESIRVDCSDRYECAVRTDFVLYFRLHQISPALLDYDWYLRNWIMESLPLAPICERNGNAASHTHFTFQLQCSQSHCRVCECRCVRGSHRKPANK